ncbi:Gfo/Idh/MocA family protein [Saccharicrinis aurantiacus]|uniref:Gfo/Idh/MocA family protein n=1 Tax=Saccharicrinis aurantiacus TaxID=1849719 RepID=UPI00094F78EB|nr:Gfo/Idh/MocA family oxidoreductase [Saccharicrinis aurantiacus]
MNSRRNFIKSTVTAAAGAAMFSSAKSYARVLGANDIINFAIVGCGGRAHGLAKSIGFVDKANITYICDVDGKRLNSFSKHCKELKFNPKLEKDFREVFLKTDVDVVVIATPEHYHAPMAIWAMQAGKHVYVEKPCSHNPYETELLIAVQKKTGKLCQMGNQQRSSKTSAMAINEIGEGIIGDPYMAKAFYARARQPIGVGKKVPAPEHLDWDLWQGPAPREPYRDNVHPYNWHWFRTWGTGEIHNNGTHEIDIARWALGVDYPTRVVSNGGRLAHSGDDWEWFDTQIASYNFEGNKQITWEGYSAQAFNPGGGRGTVIYGSKGVIQLDRGKYVLMDLKGKKLKTEWEGKHKAATDTNDSIGFDMLTVNHMRNLAAAVVKGEKLNAPIYDGGISTQLCHLGNIAQDVKVSIDVDPKTGRVLKNKDAQKMWKREYEKGWEPKL